MRSLAAALLVIHSASAPGQRSAATDRYAVTFSEQSPLTAAVEARVTSTDGALHIESYTRNQPGFWRSRLVNLVAYDSANTKLALDSLDATSWRVRQDYRGRLTLRYAVNLDFASRPFPSGNQKGGYAADGALYLVTKALFVTPDTGDASTPRDVDVHVPPGWKVETSWIERGPGRYQARSRADLTYNTIVVGRFASSRARLGGFEAIAAFVGPIARDSSVIGPAFATVTKEYFRLFPKTPPGRYMITFFYADHDDGEGFVGSSAVTFGNRIAGGDGILFNNKIAHEVLHYWIGQRIRAEDHEQQSWLSEGFTEYIANRTIYRTRLITRREYLDKLSRHLGVYGYFWYSPLFEGRTLLDAGQDKTRNRFAVYDGGAVAALVLDLTIMRASGGRRSLDDALRLLWDRYAALGRRYTLDDVISVLVEVGGEELRDFVPRYVKGHELLPYRDVLERCGVRVRAWPLSAETYLSDIPNPSAAQRAAGRQLFMQRERPNADPYTRRRPAKSSPAPSSTDTTPTIGGTNPFSTVATWSGPTSSSLRSLV